MTTTDDRDPHDLAGEYVLGTLSHADRLRVDAALAHDGALRAAMRAWEARLLPLTAMVDPVTPEPALWRRIERSLAPAAKPGTTRDAGAQLAAWWNNLPLWRTLAMGGMAAAVLAVVLVARPLLAPAPALTVVLAAPQTMQPGWVIRTTGTNRLRLTPLTAMAVAPDKSLQFWTKGTDWKGPVSLGLVTPGQPLDVSLDKLPAMQPNQLFEITLEPKNGSPIGRPTGPILFIGRAVTL